MDISSKLLNKDGDILHQLTIKNLLVKNIKFSKKQCTVNVKKKYSNNQNVVAKIKLDKSIIINHKNITNDNVVIRFNKDKINIKITNPSLKYILKKGFFAYHASYQIIIPHKINVHMKLKLDTKFYENSILPRIEKSKEKNRKDKQKVHEQRPLTPEEYRKKDIYESDRAAYRYSPNSDGSRSRREILSGNFSGESRYRK